MIAYILSRRHLKRDWRCDCCGHYSKVIPILVAKSEGGETTEIRMCGPCLRRAAQETESQQ